MNRRGLFPLLLMILMLLSGLWPHAAGAQAGDVGVPPILKRLDVYTSHLESTNAGTTRWARAGETVEFHLTFNKKVHFSSGRLQFRYGDPQQGGFTDYAEYSHLFGDKTLVFTWQVPPPEERSINLPLTGGAPAVEVIGWDGPVVIDDGVYWHMIPDPFSFPVKWVKVRVGPGNREPIPWDPNDPFNAGLGGLSSVHIDNVPPQITGITSSDSDGTYTLSEEIFLVLEFSERVRVQVDPTLVFNNGAQSIEADNIYEWPFEVDRVDGDQRWVVKYHINQGQATQKLNVSQILGGRMVDQAGNQLVAAVPQGNNLADNKQITIDAPVVTDKTPYLLFRPETVINYQQEVQVQVNFVSSAWPPDNYEIWYYWDENPDPAAAAATWDALRWQAWETGRRPEGVGVVNNTEVIVSPSDATGLLYLHARVAEKDPFFFPGFVGGYFHGELAMQVTVGPYAVDSAAPEVTIPPGFETVGPNGAVAVAVSDPGAGPGEVNYQWYRVLGGGTEQPYGSSGTTYVYLNRESAWVPAPDEAGTYRLDVQVTDKVGHQTTLRSDPITVTASAQTGTPPLVEFPDSGMDSAVPAGRPVNPTLPSAGMFPGAITPKVTAQTGSLGQVFYLWDTSAVQPDQLDPRWELAYIGDDPIPTQEEARPPAESGVWYLHVQAYDQYGNRTVATAPYPVLVDMEPPQVSITPNGHEPVQQFNLKLQVNENMTTDPANLRVELRFRREDSPPYVGYYTREENPCGDLPVSDYDYLTADWVLTEGTGSLVTDLVTSGLDVDARQNRWGNGEYYLHACVADVAGNYTQFVSQPFELRSEGPMGEIRIDPKQVGGVLLPMEVTVDSGTGVEISYVVDHVDLEAWGPHSPDSEAGMMCEFEPMCVDYTYYDATVRDDAPWSEWQPYQPVIPVEIPADTGIHVISFRFRDPFGESPYPAQHVVYYDPSIPYHNPYPIAYVTYDTQSLTRYPVTATLNLRGGYWDHEAGNVIWNNDGYHQYVFRENGEFTFEYQYWRYYRGTATARVTWIDTTPPEAGVAYSTELPTNGAVVAQVFAAEPITVVGQDGSTSGSHTFTENGTFTFTVRDRAGNATQVVAQVSNIDRTPPAATATLAVAGPGEAEVTLHANEPFAVVAVPEEARGDGVDLSHQYLTTHVYRVDREGTFTFTIRDQAGNEAAVSVTITDIAPPEVYLSYSTTEPTRDDVTVTLLADRPVVFVDDTGEPVGSTLTFTANGSRLMRYQDDRGWEYRLPVQVRNIDRQAPAITFGQGEFLLVVQGDHSFDPLADVQVRDNLDVDLADQVQISHDVDPDTPGTYTVTYRVTDRAGNSAEVTRPVRVVSTGPFQVYVNTLPPDAQGMVRVVGDRIQLQLFGARGETRIRWAEGRQAAGYFKGRAGSGRDGAGRAYGELEDTELVVSRGGWYTLYIQDQERQTRLIQVYLQYR